jgi:hypothetical protein
VVRQPSNLGDLVTGWPGVIVWCQRCDERPIEIDG